VALKCNCVSINVFEPVYSALQLQSLTYNGQQQALEGRKLWLLHSICQAACTVLSSCQLLATGKLKISVHGGPSNTLLRMWRCSKPLHRPLHCIFGMLACLLINMSILTADGSICDAVWCAQGFRSKGLAERAVLAQQVRWNLQLPCSCQLQSVVNPGRQQ
jgi:hypothetical protein